MRLLTWNVNARQRIEQQLAVIASRSPDLIALQEVTPRSVLLWRSAFLTLGYSVADSFAASTPWESAGPRRYALLVASRYPVEPHRSSDLVPWPERLLSVDVVISPRPVAIHTTHIPPGSSHGWLKVDMLEAVAAVVAQPSAMPQILCGDFNVPQCELTDGTIVTWAERLVQDKPPRMMVRKRRDDGRRWDSAERTIMEGGPQRALVDAYRQLHGYARQEFSWFVRRGELRVGRRFDHVFCSPDIRISCCEYLHDVRENGLSDHSALEMDFEV